MDRWTPAELASLKMHVAPIVTAGEMRTVDSILTDGNIAWTGEHIRNRLFEAGFRVVKIETP